MKHLLNELQQLPKPMQVELINALKLQRVEFNGTDIIDPDGNVIAEQDINALLSDYVNSQTDEALSRSIVLEPTYICHISDIVLSGDASADERGIPNGTMTVLVRTEEADPCEAILDTINKAMEDITDCLCDSMCLSISLYTPYEGEKPISI